MLTTWLQKLKQLILIIQGLHYPSMHQDYNRGRLTEIDYLNGQIGIW